jgi:ligand-binding SRPBCC domain-containing protein
MEKELKIGRLHLDQKVGENSRSQHRLNFYSQNDITKLLDEVPTSSKNEKGTRATFTRSHQD